MIPLGVLGSAHAAGGGISTFAYRHIAASASDLTAYTFSSVPIGTAGATRRVIIGAAARGVAGRSLASVSVGGVGASLVYIPANSNGTLTGWAIAEVPSGTTADVVVTWSGDMVRAGIAAWTIDGPISSTSAGVGFSTFTTTVPTVGALLCVGMGVSMEFTTPTPSYVAATGESSFTVTAAATTTPGSVTTAATPTTFAQMSGIIIEPA